MTMRTMLAFLVAPLAASLSIWLLMRIAYGSEASFWLPFMIPAAYGCAAFLGIPAHIVLTRRAWTSLWQYALAGLVIGIVPALLVSVLPSVEGRSGLIILFALFGAVLGPTGAAVFWSMAVRSRLNHAEV